MSRALLIVHPRAKRHRLCDKLLNHLIESYNFETVETEYAGHTGALVREFANQGGGLVATAGGDGTIHEAVNGWAQTGFQGELRFCPLPLGTGNDFLTSIDPRLQKPGTYLEYPIAHTLDADLGRVTFHKDGEVGERYFCCSATAGLSAETTLMREAVANKLPGKLSYIYGLVASFLFWKNRHLRVESEEEPLESEIFMNFNAANTRLYGGGMISAPNADPSDGHLDAVAMNLTLWQALLALPQNFKGHFHLVPRIWQRRLQGPFTVHTTPPSPIQADGEVLGETPMGVECLERQLPLLLPEI